MLYFAYGSNMSSARLRERVPSAVQKHTGYLKKYAIRFHKVGFRDGSAKCDACETGDPDDYVAGVIYSISPAEKKLLDNAEGLGYGYEIKNVAIKTISGQIVDAFMYYATIIDKSLRPFHWYKHHVIWGAKEHKLPDEYIDRLISVASIDDSDSPRATNELNVYRRH